MREFLHITMSPGADRVACACGDSADLPTGMGADHAPKGPMVLIPGARPVTLNPGTDDEVRMGYVEEVPRKRWPDGTVTDTPASCPWGEVLLDFLYFHQDCGESK